MCVSVCVHACGYISGLVGVNVDVQVFFRFFFLVYKGQKQTAVVFIVQSLCSSFSHFPPLSHSLLLTDLIADVNGLLLILILAS